MRLETERLILREWEDRDRAALAAILGDATVRRFYPAPATFEQVSGQIDYSIEQARLTGFHMQAAELKSTGELVGLIGIGVIPERTRQAIPGTPQVEIGWQFAERFWGRGLAPEAAKAWIEAGWSHFNLPEIVAFTATINRPSQRVMEKIGMSHDPAGSFEHPNIAEGHPLRPHVLYRIASPNGA